MALDVSSASHPPEWAGWGGGLSQSPEAGPGQMGGNFSSRASSWPEAVARTKCNDSTASLASSGRNQPSGQFRFGARCKLIKLRPAGPESRFRPRPCQLARKWPPSGPVWSGLIRPGLVWSGPGRSGPKQRIGGRNQLKGLPAGEWSGRCGPAEIEMDNTKRAGWPARGRTSGSLAGQRHLAGA